MHVHEAWAVRCIGEPRPFPQRNGSVRSWWYQCSNNNDVSNRRSDSEWGPCSQSETGTFSMVSQSGAATPKIQQCGNGNQSDARDVAYGPTKRANGDRSGCWSVRSAHRPHLHQRFGPLNIFKIIERSNIFSTPLGRDQVFPVSSFWCCSCFACLPIAFW